MICFGTGVNMHRRKNCKNIEIILNLLIYIQVKNFYGRCGFESTFDDVIFLFTFYIKRPEIISVEKSIELKLSTDGKIDEIILVEKWRWKVECIELLCLYGIFFGVSGGVYECLLMS